MLFKKIGNSLISAGVEITVEILLTITVNGSWTVKQLVLSITLSDDVRFWETLDNSFFKVEFAVILFEEPELSFSHELKEINPIRLINIINFDTFFIFF